MSGNEVNLLFAAPAPLLFGTGAIFGDYSLIDLGGFLVIVAIIVYVAYLIIHARKVKGKQKV